ncbi:MAG: tRNA lysidine(34) synthetase TilS [Desulfobacteraceae bacterium]|nr:tRNA lysidine(34) synthetase TilS [Desulfobacteraceae bacterium]
MNHPSFQERVLAFVHRNNLIAAGDRLLIAVSGGPDSTALLDVLVSLQSALNCSGLTVLHFDHRLRGEDSDADRRFVESLAEKYRLPVCVESADVRSRQHQQRGISLEMAARECRHEFFKTSLKRVNAQRIALGHTADDQAEEILLRLVRGTGPSGLSGMLPGTRSGIVRPLLFATRSEILDYLHERSLSFRDDTTNQEPFCQRNALRLKVFPVLKDFFHPQIAQTLSRHAFLAAEEESFWKEHLHGLFQKGCTFEDAFRLDLGVPFLLSLHPAVQKRLLRFAVERLQGHTLSLYAVHIELLVRWIAKSSPGKVLHLPRGLTASLGKDSLSFNLQPSQPETSPEESGHRRRRQPPPPPKAVHGEEITLFEPGRYELGSYLFQLREIEPPISAADPRPPASPSTVFLDYDKIRWPMTLRWWRPGDRFQPLGLKGTRKLQDFFTDAKIPRGHRDSIPVLCDREKICWLAGLRLDERVKVEQGTRRVLVVDFSENHSV